MYWKRHIRAILALTAGALMLLAIAVTPAAAGDWGDSPRESRYGQNDNDDLPPTGPAFVPHQLVVKLRTDTVRFSADNAIVQEYSAYLTEEPVYLVELDPGVDVLQAAAAFSASADVEYAHPNYVLNRAHPIQGSYPFSDQNFKGDYEHQYASTQLGLDQAHQLALGTGTVVGVIDGGIDFSHPALGGMAVSGHDFVDEDDDATDEPGGPTSGHGTFVAGVIHLVAPGATIRSYRVMNASGDGDGFTVARAIERAVTDGCSILNISLALTARSLAVRDAIDRASAQGVLVVGGAGNLGSNDPVYPAAEDNVLAVAALDSLYAKASFSSFGSYVDLCAPGEDVYSSYQKPYYAWWSGTSFSAPFVSGLAALARQKFAGSDGLQLRNRLMVTAADIDVQNPNYMGTLGAGVVNPAAALTAAVTNDTAVFIPDTLYYTYQQYSQILVIPQVTGVLISTNAPAPYIPHIVDTGTFAFAMVDDTSGTTNDSVTIFLNTTNTLGTYYNTIAFEIIGVANPALVTVELTVAPQDTVGSVAWLNPPEMWFTGNINTYSVLKGASLLSSTNAPAVFHAEIPSGTGGFLTLTDSVGQTNDSVRFGVIPSRVPAPGLYADTIVCHVDGIAQPAALIVNLNALDSGTQISAWLNPSEVWYTGDITSDSFYIGYSFLSSSNPPASYHSMVRPVGGRFTTNLNSHGVTNDSVGFLVRPNRLLSPGLYTDTIVYILDGTPVAAMLLIHLNAVDSAWQNEEGYVYPEFSYFTAPANQNYTQTTSILVGAYGVPKSYTASLLDVSDFVQLITTSGTTIDSLVFNIVTTSATPVGIYRDTILIQMSGAPNSPLMAVLTLNVDTSQGGNPLCNLPGDVNQNGIPWEYADLVALQNALSTGDIGYLGAKIGNSDLDANCRIDTVDRVKLEMIILGYDSAPGTPCGNCPSYVFITDTVGNPGGDSAWVIPSSVSFFVPNGSTSIAYRQVILASTLATNYYANQSGDGNWLVYDSTGLTNDSVLIGADPTGLPAGIYADTITFLVNGTRCRCAVYLPVVLTITGADSVLAGPGREVTLTNYPNPFNPQTECVYSIPTTAHVTLTVYDVLGREVIRLVDETREAGTHRVLWRGQTSGGNQASSGVYLYRLEANGVSVTRKMLLLK